MHFDESVESNADSDFEDGEIRQLLTSSLYDHRASGKPDAMDIQESEVNAQESHSSEGQKKLPGDQLHCFHQHEMKRDHMWSSVFSGTLLAGNQDHLLNQARSDLARKEISCGVSQ